MTGKIRPHVPLLLSVFSAALILFLRKPQAVLHAQFWAEDAALFFRENLIFGAQALFKTYAGYFHLLPRLFSWTGSLLPYEALPLFYNLSAAAAFSASAFYLCGPRLQIKYAFLFPLMSVFVPHNGECFLSLTNLQWMAAPYLILFCFRRPPESPKEWGMDAAAVLLLGLTGPFILFCMPFFLWRAWKEPSGLFRSWTFIAAAAAITQFAAVFLHREDAAGIPFSEYSSSWLSIFTGRLGGFVMPFYSADVWAEKAGWAVSAALLVFFCSLILKSEKRFFYTAVLGYAILELAAAFFKNRHMSGILGISGNGERYFYFAAVLSSWALMAALSENKIIFRRAAAFFVVMLLCTSFSRFQAAAWPDLKWAEQAARLRSGDVFRMDVNPAGWGLDAGRRGTENWLKMIKPENAA